jgi:hypothetical protein
MTAEGIHVLNERVRPTSTSLYMDDHVLISPRASQSDLLERAALLPKGSGGDTSYGIENCFGMVQKDTVEKKRHTGEQRTTSAHSRRGTASMLGRHPYNLYRASVR